MTPGSLILHNGSRFDGRVFGAEKSVAGEVVFSTGMVGYPEALTDPSYRGQILVLTYPLIGNYGVPADADKTAAWPRLESDRIQVQGLIVAEHSIRASHWDAARSLDDWLSASGVPGLCGIDTRALTKLIRHRGTMLGKLIAGEDVPWSDPNSDHLVASVSCRQPAVYGTGRPRIVLVDCGCKTSIIKHLVDRSLSVIRVPWDFDFFDEPYDGVVISSGPGDPKHCADTIQRVKRVMERGRPIFGICLGHQILALAAGADTYKLPFGHRSQNQPCIELGTGRCYLTSQNHGYAVRTETLPPGWRPWFSNGNDGTNEGIRHERRPFLSVQFHPEASPGPLDTAYLFDEFVKQL